MFDCSPRSLAGELQEWQRLDGKVAAEAAAGNGHSRLDLW
jgi:hypothetical protein